MTEISHESLGVEEKLSFLSDDWFDFLRRSLVEVVRRHQGSLQDADYSICEVFTSCPDGGERAHWMHIKAGEVSFGDGERDNADMRLVIDYATCLPMSRLTSGPELERAAKSATEQGRMRQEGATGPPPEALAGALGEIHDAVAGMTA